MLNKKLIRDLLRQRWQVIAVIIVVLLGTALFDGSYLAYQNLQQSYTATQQRTHLADVTVAAAKVTPKQVQRVQRIPGIQQAASQLVLSMPVVVPKGKTVDNTTGKIKVDGRLISVPLDHQPALNQVVVVKGHYPKTSDEILVERHFADYHQLQPGETLQLQTPSGTQSVVIAGVAVSAKYLWVARNRQDVFPSPLNFGVFFVPRPTLTALAHRTLAAPVSGNSTFQSNALANLQLAATSNDGNRLLYTLKPGADKTTVGTDIRNILGSTNILNTTPRKQEIDIQLLQMDLNGFKEMAEAFPLFFLTVAAFIVAALMNRLVNRERTLIGTMMAIGMRRRTILSHYLRFSLLIGAVGVVLGTGLGWWMGTAMTHAYASELHIPFVFTQPNWMVLSGGIFLGLVAPFLAGLFPALRAARLKPAEAMRQSPGKSSGRHKKSAAARHSRGPLWWRLALRDVLRHPGRTLGTAAGVMAALILVVTTGGLEDSMTRGLNISLTQSQRYDLRADFYVPQSTPNMSNTIKNMTGVKQVQTLITLPVQVKNPTTGQTYETALQGISPDTTLLQLRTPQGTVLHPKAKQAILTTSVAKKLGLHTGDKISIQALPQGKKISVTVGQLGFSTLGNSVTLPLSEVAKDFTLTGKTTTALVTTDSAHRSAVRKQLESLPNVARIQDESAFQKQVHGLMGLMNLLLGIMLISAVILAASILFNTASLNIVERQREFATMRALGYRDTWISLLITTSNSLIALLGLIVGFPLALLSLKEFLGLYSSDLFSLPFWLYPRTVIISVTGILLVLLISQWPALRTVRRMNLAAAAKLRE